MTRLHVHAFEVGWAVAPLTPIGPFRRAVATLRYASTPGLCFDHWVAGRCGREVGHNFLLVQTRSHGLNRCEGRRRPRQHGREHRYPGLRPHFPGLLDLLLSGTPHPDVPQATRCLNIVTRYRPLACSLISDSLRNVMQTKGVGCLNGRGRGRVSDGVHSAPATPTRLYPCAHRVIVSPGDAGPVMESLGVESLRR
jgi:hypothetical protein